MSDDQVVAERAARESYAVYAHLLERHGADELARRHGARYVAAMESYADLRRRIAEDRRAKLQADCCQ